MIDQHFFEGFAIALLIVIAIIVCIIMWFIHYGYIVSKRQMRGED